MELEEAVKSGQFCKKELYRMFPDISEPKLAKIAADLGLVKYKKQFREKFLQSHRDAVRKMWANDIKDPEISKTIGISVWDVKAVRIRFGFINDHTGTLAVRRQVITEMYANGSSDETIAEHITKMTGEVMSAVAVRAFRYRENILDERKVRDYSFKIMEELRPIFMVEHMKGDTFISRKTGYARNTITKYRQIFMEELIEKAAS